LRIATHGLIVSCQRKNEISDACMIRAGKQDGLINQ
jgi:hypothetical protein